ncbi:hypothetical protein GGR28_002423 [Lewinella aquimaris]|uniref:Secretion system C-terminal sorting domain-containing protein n=1 Tax=Neolewinella aquimaris TaxID=1835722 RepID=A0A840EFU4_9BACT|nr:hypothetical protein [Neolewinella aquimaris]MBB4079796.1 hypothetical protein [Neolewinella aquimaris]
MRLLCILLIVGIVLPIGPVQAQKLLPPISDRHGGCYLPPVVSDYTFSRPYTFRDAVRPKTLTYDINYLTDGDSLNGFACSTWPAGAEMAFEYAAAIWSDALQNDKIVNVEGCYTSDLTGNTLGSAGASLRGIGPFLGYDAVVFPQAIVEQLVDIEYPTADIRVYINANYFDDFYFGTDANPPNDQIDFVSLAVHELGHGLGFFGSARIDDGEDASGTGSDVECDGVAGNGCLGYFFDATGAGAEYYPAVYDLFVDRGSDMAALTSVSPNPGPDLATAFTGGNTGLFFDETNINDFDTGTEQLQLYTPGTFQPGSSYSHFNDPTEVMYYALSYGSANHDVGKAAQVMTNIGWPAAAAGLPVELLAFTGAPDDRGMRLEWQTASERDNEAFEVEVSRNEAPFERIGRLPGSGTTHTEVDYTYLDDSPSLGANHYRLRQIDFDGTATYSPIITLRFEVAGTSIGQAYPNPVRADRLSLDYRTDATRQVAIQLFDSAGRLLQRVRYTAGPGNNRLSLNLGDFPPGLCHLQIEDGREIVHQVVAVK